MEFSKLVILISIIIFILLLLTHKLFTYAYLAIYEIRKALKQYSQAISGAKYRGFDTIPIVYGESKGYRFKFGAMLMRRRDGGLSASLFEKVKLKNSQQIPWDQKDSLSLPIANERLVIEWGWLTRYHDISHKIPAESVARAKKILSESATNNVMSLIEIAQHIDAGTLNIEREISKNTTEARREFFIGSLAAIGTICFFWVLWYFKLLR